MPMWSRREPGQQPIRAYTPEDPPDDDEAGRDQLTVETAPLAKIGKVRGAKRSRKR